MRFGRIASIGWKLHAQNEFVSLWTKQLFLALFSLQSCKIARQGLQQGHSPSITSKGRPVIFSPLRFWFFRIFPEDGAENESGRKSEFSKAHGSEPTQYIIVREQLSFPSRPRGQISPTAFPPHSSYSEWV